MSESSIQSLQESSFTQHVLEAKQPSVVVLGASWSKDTTRMLPLIEEHARQFDDKVNTWQLDVDLSDVLVGQFTIDALPVLLAVRDGAILKRLDGLSPSPEIEELYTFLTK